MQHLFFFPTLTEHARHLTGTVEGLRAALPSTCNHTHFKLTCAGVVDKFWLFDIVHNVRIHVPCITIFIFTITIFFNGMD